MTTVSPQGKGTMPPRKKTAKGTKKKKARQDNGARLGFEATLWQAADKLRGHMDAAEYKHVVLGLIFLKYISDAFEEKRQSLERVTADPASFSIPPRSPSASGSLPATKRTAAFATAADRRSSSMPAGSRWTC